jgi:hypothetical protein
VFVAKDFKFFRKNTFKSVDSRWFKEELNLYKSNFWGPEGSEGGGAGEGVRKVGGVEFTRKGNTV